MRKYIGYGYTNNQGIATLDYDANGTAISPSGYTGTGGGEIDIQAELHDDSSIVSVPCEIWDTIFNFDGTSPTKYLWYNSEKVDCVPSSDGFHITAKGNYSVDVLLTNDNTVPSTPNTSPLDGTKDLIFEFDFKTAQQLQINLRDASYARVTGFVPSYSSNFRHWKWIYSASEKKCDVYEDNNQGVLTKKGTIDLSNKNMTHMGIQWIDWQSTQGDTMDCWIKNFKVYYG